MTNTNQNALDIKGIVRASLISKLTEAGIDLTDIQIDGVTDFLVYNQTLEIKNVKDLNGFYHTELSEGAETPAVSLLVNNAVVYVYSGTRQVPAQLAEYKEYLEDNDLYESEYGIDQYLADNELVMTFEDQEFVNVSAVDVGRLYLSALSTKESAAQQLAEANSTLEKLTPVIGANFIPMG